MNSRKLILAVAFLSPCIFGQDPALEIALPQADEAEENDLEWLQILFADLDQNNREPSTAEQARINDVFRNQAGIEKGYAGMIMATYLPVSKYVSLLEELLSSLNVEENTAAIEFLDYKLTSGTHDEKRYLMSHSGLIEKVKQLSNRSKSIKGYRLDQLHEVIEELKLPSIDSPTVPDKDALSRSIQDSSQDLEDKTVSSGVARSGEGETETSSSTKTSETDAPVAHLPPWAWVIGALSAIGIFFLILKRKR